MIISRLLKYNFTSTLIPLLMTLQISACSSEDFATAIAGSFDSDTETNPYINTTAIITGTDNGRLVKNIDPDGNNLLEVGGKLDIIDNDVDEAAFTIKTVDGNYGGLTIDKIGNWDYAADNNQTVIQNLENNDSITDSLTVSSIDGTTHQVVISIIGADETDTPPPVTNDPAVITGVDTGSVTEDVDPDGDNLLEISGKLNITDSDAGEAAFVAKTINGNYGNLSIDAAGNWNYAADNNQAVIQNLLNNATLTDRLTVSSIDNTTHTVAITIIGTDEILASVSLSWVAPAEREDTTALSLSEIAGYKIYYSTTQGQYSSSVTINDSTAVGYTFTNFSSGTYYFVVTTIDTTGRESTYSPEVIKVI